MFRILTLSTIAVALLGTAAVTDAAPGAEAARPQAAESAPPPGTRPFELRGPDAVASLRARGLAIASATRAGVALGELDELFEDPTVFAGASGEIGYADPLHAEEEHTDPLHADGYNHDGIELPPGTDALSLHSRPGSTRTILLDVDGHTTSDTHWNSSYYGGAPIVSGAYDIDGDPTSFSQEERSRIAGLWRMVAEDYAPFDVNVTTADPGIEALRRVGTGDQEYGVRIVVTSTDWYYEATGKRAGGVAYLNSVMWDSDTPGFVFAGNLSGAVKPMGEAASHEAGHAAGLYHDGIVGGSAYYAGHGDWAPIMGVGYYRPVTQWSRGEYADADNGEDDLAEITSRLGVATDDHGDAPGTATAVGSPGTTGTPVTVDGVVGIADVDTFTVGPATGPVTIRLSPAPFTNLAARLTVDVGGTVTGATATPGTGWAAEVVVESIADVAVVDVRASAHLTALDGFSPYASLGAYTLTFTTGSTGTDPTTTTTTTTTTVPPTTTTTTTVPSTTTTTVPPTVAAEPAGDGLEPITPVRLADTRRGLGGSTRLAAGARMELQVTGRAGIPADATAAVLGVVAVNTGGPGFLTVFPCTTEPPIASTSNYSAGSTVANTTIATLDDRGRVCIHTHEGADVVVDVTGWIGPSGTSRLTGVGPVRAADTRTGLGGTSRLAANSTMVVDLGPFIGADATAAAVNLAAVQPGADGYLTAWPCGTNRPGTSTSNYTRGSVRANNAIVGVDAGQRLCIYTLAEVDVVVDVTGRFGTDGLGYVPSQPRRLLDTRDGRTLTAATATGYPVGPAPVGDVAAASVNVTAVRHQAPGHLTTYGCSAIPTASTVNHGAGTAVANGAVIPVTGSLTSCVWSSSAGDVLVDLLGWWVH